MLLSELSYCLHKLEKPAVGEPGAISNGDDAPDWLYAEDVARAIHLAS